MYTKLLMQVEEKGRYEDVMLKREFHFFLFYIILIFCIENVLEMDIHTTIPSVLGYVK